MGQLVDLDLHRRSARARRARDGRGGPRLGTSFFFDLADPGTYLAAERVDHMFAGVRWRPAPAAGAGVERTGEAEATRRAAALGMPLVWPERAVDPPRAAMRAAAHAAEQGRGAAFVLAASRLAFCGGFDLEDPEVLAEAASAAGLPLRECLRAARHTGADDEMARTGARLAEAGADRLPAVSVGRLLFCGEGRIAEALAAQRAGRRADRHAAGGR